MGMEKIAAEISGVAILNGPLMTPALVLYGIMLHLPFGTTTLVKTKHSSSGFCSQRNDEKKNLTTVHACICILISQLWTSRLL